MVDTIMFNKAVKKALELTDAEDTLIVVTADHGHPFTFGGYSSRGNNILGELQFSLCHSLWCHVLGSREDDVF